MTTTFGNDVKWNLRGRVNVLRLSRPMTSLMTWKTSTLLLCLALAALATYQKTPDTTLHYACAGRSDAEPPTNQPTTLTTTRHLHNSHCFVFNLQLFISPRKYPTWQTRISISLMFSLADQASFVFFGKAGGICGAQKLKEKGFLSAQTRCTERVCGAKAYGSIRRLMAT